MNVRTLKDAYTELMFDFIEDMGGLEEFHRMRKEAEIKIYDTFIHVQYPGCHPIQVHRAVNNDMVYYIVIRPRGHDTFLAFAGAKYVAHLKKLNFMPPRLSWWTKVRIWCESLWSEITSVWKDVLNGGY